MKFINIQFNIVFSALVFTCIYFGLSYYLLALITQLVYKIVALLILLIFYANIMRLFIFEILSIKQTRASEVLNYFLMYVVTAAAILLPFFVGSTYIFEVSYIRNIIVIFAAVLLVKYFLYMILSPIHDIVHRFRHYKYFQNKKYEPFVSVIVPAWNEEVGIIGTLQSVLANSYRNFELVVINDGSTDNSDRLIRDFIKRYYEQGGEINIKYKYKENAGKGAALNDGIDISNGDLIISIDADCSVDAEAIAAFVEEFKDPDVKAAVGNVKIGNKKSTVGMVQYLEFLFSFYFKRAESLMGSIYIIGGAAGAFRRQVFESIGKYNTSNITEDIELTVRIQDAGMKISYVPEAIVFTEGASDLNSLKKQRLRWKRGRLQTFLQYPHLFFSTKKKHNKFLTFFTMPLAVFSEIQLLFEIPFVVFLYIFSVLNSDFSSLFAGVVIVGTMFVTQFMFYEKSTRTLSFALLAPIGWLLFYIATYVEAYALLKTISSFVTKSELTWQSWDRKGLEHARSI